MEIKIPLIDETIEWLLKKIDNCGDFIKRQFQKFIYKQRTEKEYFGLLWKYQWVQKHSHLRKQEAVAYCPECRNKLFFNNSSFYFCPECNQEYYPEDKKEKIIISDAILRMTNIFKSKEDLN